MKEIIKIERFLKVYENTWENQRWLIESEGYSRINVFTLHVNSDFGEYPNLIDFEAELLTVDKNLINEKIKNINLICDKMINNYEFIMSNRNNLSDKLGIHCYHDHFLTTNNFTISTKELKFDDNDLITTIFEIKSIIENTLNIENLTTKMNKVRMTAIHKYLSDEKYIDVDIDSWLHWFSLQTWTKKTKPKKINWIGAAYHLPNVVFLICGNMEKQTKDLMEKIFTLPKKSNFQSMTISKNNPKRDIEPYRTLYNKIEMAEKTL